MIHNIFYAQVLFPEVQYGKDFYGWTLENISEAHLGSFLSTWKSIAGESISVIFTHKNFCSQTNTQNWEVDCIDTGLLTHLVNHLAQKSEFLFFETPEFYNKIPFGTVLTITSKCNIFCSYCFNDYDYPLDTRNERKSIGFEKYRTIVDKLYEAGTRDIIITGGEPFVCDFLFELLRYIRDKGIFIRINTNGTLLSENMLEKLNAEFSLSLMVSMHEFNDKDYFNANKEGIISKIGEKGLKVFERYFSNKVNQLEQVPKFKNLTLDFLTILTPKNILYLDDIYAWVLGRFHLENWHFFRLYSNDKGPGISKAMMILAIHKLYKLNKKYGVNFKIVDSVPFCVTKDIDKAAQVIDGELSENHNVKTIITTDGYIQIMSAFDSNLGSIFENNILDIWHGEYVQKMLHHGFLPKECSDCRYKESCRGGSRMNANIYNGSYDAFDPLGDIKNKVI